MTNNKIAERFMGPFLVIFGLNVLLVGVLVWGYWYWQDSLTSLATNQAELLSLDKKITDLSQLKRLMAETATDRAKIGAYFLSTNTLPDFIDNLEGLATTTQVTLKVTNVVLDEEAVAAVLTFETVASFANTHRFIALVQQLPYQLRFTEANITNNGAWAGVFKLRLSSFIKEPNV